MGFIYLILFFSNIFQKVKIDLSSTYFLNCSEPKFWYASITVFIVFTSSLWLTIVLLNKLCPNVVEPQLSIVTCLLIALTGLFNQGEYETFALKQSLIRFTPGVSQELRTITTRAQFFVITTFGYTIYTALNAMLVRELATYSIEFLSNNDEIVRTLPICMPDNIIVYDRMLVSLFSAFFGLNLVSLVVLPIMIGQNYSFWPEFRVENWKQLLITFGQNLFQALKTKFWGWTQARNLKLVNLKTARLTNMTHV